jgi:ABC-type multidrug transport system fused ATPase/permease subunit
MKRRKSKNKKTFKYIKKCIPYFMEVKSSVILLIILSLIFSVISPLFPAFIAKVLDLVTSLKFEEAIISGTIVIILSILTDAINIPLRNAFVKVQTSVSNSLKKDVINSYFMIRNKELIKTSSGIFLTRITNDPEVIVRAFMAIRSNISTILSNLFVFIYIFYLHHVLGVITLIGTFVVYLVEKKAMNKWSSYRKEINKSKDSYYLL